MGYIYCPKDKKALFYSGDFGHVNSTDEPRPDLLQCSQTGADGHNWQLSINEGCWILREVVKDKELS